MNSTSRLAPRLAALLVLGGFSTASAEVAAVLSAPAPKLTPSQARAELREAVTDFFTRELPDELARPRALLGVPEAELAAPERKSLAAATTVSFQQPEEIWSADGRLSVTLVGMKARNYIGDDPVYLRSYNGKLVGPTLRAKAGDTLRITLRNDFAPEADHPGEMNTLHAFNTMNLHTHGLHVSPSGISDNVLLDVPPQATQDYEIAIPKDHPAGTFWYHTHRHGSTAAQVASGMAGALIIAGGMDDVPEIAKARERVLVFQQIAYLYKNCFTDKAADGKETKVCYDLPYGVIEAEYENRIFPPGSWDKLGRHTTINGIELPVFRVRPGSVERWRMVHAGVRESIKVRLELAATAGQPDATTIALHEIAVDGLSLGKLAPQQTVELWPGYRSDVLVQFPAAPGEYLLIDEASTASLDGTPESRKYLGRVIVEGDPNPMPLPQSAQIAQYRLPSIPADKVNGPPQDVTYGILVKDGATTFNVNGRPFSMERARELKLGDTAEWTIRSENVINGKPAAISHPHHIHVNPFEVYSILDDKGVEQLKAPVWRDTVIINGGWTVKARTRYETFAGLFVQHCHILDHEDQGMMELVEITDPAPPAAGTTTTAHPPSGNPSLRLAQAFAAPGWELPDATGKRRKLDEFLGRPTVLVFFKGEGCLHCAEQIALLRKRAKVFENLGAKLVAVSTDDVTTLAAALESAPTPFLMVSDAEKAVFRAYGCGDDATLHGTFVLDAAGAVRWKTTGATPFMAIDNVIAEVARLVPSQVAAR